MAAESGVSQIGVTDLTHGIAEDETGVLIERIRIRGVNKKAPILSRLGQTKGMKYYDPQLNVNIEGAIQGSQGLAAAALGVAITTANATGAQTAIFGVQGGRLVVEDPALDLNQSDWVKLTLNAQRYPLIAAT